jgi:hypothetical protein
MGDPPEAVVSAGRLSGDGDQAMGDGWEIVETVGTVEEATLIVGFLQSRGVPAAVESLLFRQEPVTFGRLGEVRVRVPAEHVEEARRLLEERRARFPVVPDENSEDEEGAAGGREEAS